MSEVNELVKRLREPWDQIQSRRVAMEMKAADALTALAAENERLREALGSIAKSPVKAWDRDGDLYAKGMNSGRIYCANIARAALTGKEDGDG